MNIKNIIKAIEKEGYVECSFGESIEDNKFNCRIYLRGDYYYFTRKKLVKPKCSKCGQEIKNE